MEKEHEQASEKQPCIAALLTSHWKLQLHLPLTARPKYIWTLTLIANAVALVLCQVREMRIQLPVCISNSSQNRRVQTYFSSL